MVAEFAARGQTGSPIIGETPILNSTMPGSHGREGSLQNPSYLNHDVLLGPLSPGASSASESTYIGFGDISSHMKRKELFSQRKQREFIPDNKKDNSYWDRRRRNNEAAKRSREKRRFNDMVLEQRVVELTKENHVLKAQLEAIKEEYGICGENIVCVEKVLATLPTSEQVLSITKRPKLSTSTSPTSLLFQSNGAPAQSPIPTPVIHQPIGHHSVMSSPPPSVGLQSHHLGHTLGHIAHSHLQHPHHPAAHESNVSNNSGSNQLPNGSYHDNESYHQHMHPSYPYTSSFHTHQEHQHPSRIIASPHSHPHPHPHSHYDIGSLHGTDDALNLSSRSRSRSRERSRSRSRMPSPFGVSSGSGSGDEAPRSATPLADVVSHAETRSAVENNASTEANNSLPLKLRHKSHLGDKDAASALLQLQNIKQEPGPRASPPWDAEASSSDSERDSGISLGVEWTGGSAASQAAATLQTLQKHSQMVMQDDSDSENKHRLHSEIVRLSTEVANLKSLVIRNKNGTTSVKRAIVPH